VKQFNQSSFILSKYIIFVYWKYNLFGRKL